MKLRNFHWKYAYRQQQAVTLKSSEGLLAWTGDLPVSSPTSRMAESLSFSLAAGQKPHFLSMWASALGCSPYGSCLPERKQHCNQDGRCRICSDLISEMTYYHINVPCNVEGDYIQGV